MGIQQQCVEVYRKHKHLKLAADEIGIPWQTVYVHLKAVNEPVVGDKLRYGSDGDKLAARSEQHFMEFVPSAQDMNRHKYQSKYDFIVNGWRVDVKASRYSQNRHAFSLKKQILDADFWVCFGYDEKGKIECCLLVPGDVAIGMQTISYNPRGKWKSKWADYLVGPDSLNEFFHSLPHGGHGEAA